MKYRNGLLYIAIIASTAILIGVINHTAELEHVTPSVVKLAEVEGLEGHAEAMKIRFEDD